MFQHLQHCRWRAFLRLAHQQMHMVGHHYVPYKKESVFSVDPAQFLDEQVSCPHRPEQRQPPVTAEGQKMKMSMPVIPLQSLRHAKPPPSKPEGGAPPRFHPRYLTIVISSHRVLPSNENEERAPGPPVQGWGIEDHGTGASGTYAHELANILDETLHPTRDDRYGMHHGTPGADDPDTGARVEDCLQKKLRPKP